MTSDLNKLPPLSPVRLVVGLMLVTVGWLGYWAKWHHDLGLGSIAFTGSFFAVVWLTGILSWQPKGDIKPLHSILMIAGFMAFLAVLWFGENLPAWAKEALLHPAAFATGWVITSGLLVSHWWKRRNNTPHLSDHWTPLSRR